eukprot:279270_1
MGNGHSDDKSDKKSPNSVDPTNVSVPEISFRCESILSSGTHDDTGIEPPAPLQLALPLNISSIPESGSPTLHSTHSQPNAISKGMRLTAKSKSCSTIARHHRRKSSLLIINNGITGKYISSRICKIVAKFWHEHIDTLSTSQQLEISCSIFFGMLSTNNDMKKVMKDSNCKQESIENISLKYLNMMGWLARYLVTNNVDLYALLSKLGGIHRSMGIDIHHFTPMLAAIHDTFGYYFDAKYNIEIKYAMDEIFSLAAQLMTGQSLKRSAHLLEVTQQFKGETIPFLKNLDVCLHSNIGKEYLYRYFAQTWCDEISIFLKSIHRFKLGVSDKERFMIARDIIKVSVEPDATFALNISYDLRNNTLYRMSKLELMFHAKKVFTIATEFFAELEKEIEKLIFDNHWQKFVDGIESLHSKSFNICMR